MNAPLFGAQAAQAEICQAELLRRSARPEPLVDRAVQRMVDPGGEAPQPVGALLAWKVLVIRSSLETREREDGERGAPGISRRCRKDA